MDYIKLSKEISYVLRHNPTKYNLDMDEFGYVKINELLNGLNDSGQFKEIITLKDLKEVIKVCDKERFKIDDDKIKALYGHTIPLKIKMEEVIPPDILYHGTTKKALDNILNKGLDKRKRQYVHLAKEKEVAYRVGKRRDEEPVILKIAAKKAYLDGIIFYYGGDDIYLAEYVPTNYISIDDNVFKL